MHKLHVMEMKQWSGTSLALEKVFEMDKDNLDRELQLKVVKGHLAL